MRAATLIGCLMIVLGLGALAYQGFTYTTRETVVDLGPIQATKETRRTIPLPPVVGALALLSGVALVMTGARRSLSTVRRQTSPKRSRGKWGIPSRRSSPSVRRERPRSVASFDRANEEASPRGYRVG